MVLQLARMDSQYHQNGNLYSSEPNGLETALQQEHVAIRPEKSGTNQKNGQ